MDLSKPAEQRSKQAWDSKGTIPKTEPSFTTVGNTPSSLCTMLQPLIFVVKLFGMNISDKPYYSSAYGRISVGYSVFTILVLCLLLGWNMRLLRNVTGLDSLVMYAGVLAFPLLATYQATHTFAMCVSDNGWRRLFTRYQLTQKGIWPTEACSKMWQHTFIYILVCLISIFTLIFFDAYFKVFSSHSFASGSVFLTYLEFFLAFYQQVWVIIPTVLLVYLNYLIVREFRLFNEKLEELSQSSPLEVTRSIGEIRDMHKRLSDLTQAADRLFSAPTVMCIICHLVMICSTLYSLIYVPFNLGNPIEMAAKVTWMIASFLLLFATIGTCAWLNEKAHASLGTMVNVRITKASVEESLQIHMFLQKLSVFDIGITAGGMVVIRKDVVLTVIGMLITYFLLLVQFKGSAPDTHGSAAFSDNTTLSTMSLL